MSEPTAEVTALYDLVGTAFISKSDDFKMEIGDSKQSAFYPQIKLIRSPKIENEFNFSLRLAKDIAGAAVTCEKERIVQTFPDGTITRFYAIADGYEFEIYLPERPADDTVSFTTQSKELLFYLQPTLANVDPDGSSWEVNEFGMELRRPADINESLAVYYAGGKAHNEYKAGKAFHLKRPKAVDAKSQEFWCDWVLDAANVPTGIRIPAEAVYPLLLDPTLGNNTAGASEVGLGPAKISAVGPFTMTEAGDATAIQFYQKEQRDHDVTMGIYNSSSGATGSLRADTAGGAIGNDGPAWQAQSISNSLPGGTEVRLAIAHNGAGGSTNLLCAYDDGTTANTVDYVDSTYVSGTLPDPYPSHNYLAFLVSIYIDYTATGGGAPTSFEHTARGMFIGVMRGGR